MKLCKEYLFRSIILLTFFSLKMITVTLNHNEFYGQLCGEKKKIEQFWPKMIQIIIVQSFFLQKIKMTIQLSQFLHTFLTHFLTSSYPAQICNHLSCFSNQHPRILFQDISKWNSLHLLKYNDIELIFIEFRFWTTFTLVFSQKLVIIPLIIRTSRKFLNNAMVQV